MENFKNTVTALIKTGGPIVAVFICLAVLFYAISYGLLGACSQIGNGYLTLVYCAILGIPGWRMLDRITPDVFLIMPIVGWLVFFCVKALLAILVGFFVLPAQLAAAGVKRFAASRQ